MTQLFQISIFPVKSLDRLQVESSPLLPSGALRGDREFAIFDEMGRVMNAKRNAAIHNIRSHYEWLNRSVTLSASGLTSETFHLDGDRAEMGMWLSEFFGCEVHLEQNVAMGFPDDPESPGPTIVSTQSLESVASWFDGMTLEEVRSRFRTNLELDAPEAFWEDQLFGSEDQLKAFTIGHVNFHGVNPCQRCIVPTRDSISGDVTAAFQKTFLNHRKATLPPTVDRSRFNHFYRLAVNTRSNQSGVVNIGDSVCIGDQRENKVLEKRLPNPNSGGT